MPRTKTSNRTLLFSSHQGLIASLTMQYSRYFNQYETEQGIKALKFPENFSAVK